MAESFHFILIGVYYSIMTHQEHLCHNTFCVNPDHLILGTRRDCANLRRPRMGNRLNYEQVRNMRNRHLFKRETISAIALDYPNIHYSTIWNAISGKSYKNVK